MTDENRGLFGDYLEIVDRQLPTTKEPKNGGGSVSTFFSALAEVDEGYKLKVSVPVKSILSGS